MPRHLNIPDRHKAAFKYLAGTTDDEIDRLISALSNTQPTLNPDVFAERVVSKDDSLNANEVTRLISAIVPLFWLRRDIGPGAIIDDIGKALQKDSELDLSVEMVASLKDRLAKLMALEATLGATARALAVYSDDQHTFCSGKIITDIRPVYKSDPEQDPVAAVIVHTLKIAYHEGNDQEHKEFFVALDESDLLELAGMIARAKAKSVSAQRMLDKSMTPYLSDE